MLWFPDQIIKSQNEDTRYKRNKSEIFICVMSKKNFLINAHKLSDHPIRVGADPNSDGKIMTQFRNNMSGSPTDNDGYDESWKDHSDAKNRKT